MARKTEQRSQLRNRSYIRLTSIPQMCYRSCKKIRVVAKKNGHTKLFKFKKIFRPKYSGKMQCLKGCPYMKSRSKELIDKAIVATVY